MLRFVVVMNVMVLVMVVLKNRVLENVVRGGGECFGGGGCGAEESNGEESCS